MAAIFTPVNRIPGRQPTDTRIQVELAVANALKNQAFEESG
jgi:hypothetical protein